MFLFFWIVIFAYLKQTPEKKLSFLTTYDFYNITDILYQIKDKPFAGIIKQLYVCPVLIIKNY